MCGAMVLTEVFSLDVEVGVIEVSDGRDELVLCDSDGSECRGGGA